MEKMSGGDGKRGCREWGGRRAIWLGQIASNQLTVRYQPHSAINMQSTQYTRILN